MDERLPEPGQTFAGRYTIRERIGQGGMAVVYRAHDDRHDRDVALKVLHPVLTVVLGEERFLREVATTARLTHPNLVPLFDSGVEHGLRWYAMPLLTGKTLQDRLDAEGPLPLDDAFRIFADVASALEYAHREGVIHRDLKPGNILLQGDRAAIADFGIALPIGSEADRITEMGLSLGTPTYMSPEQAVGDRVLDGRSDEYALGCVLYEMLAGEPPYQGPTAKAVLAKRLRDPIPSLRTLREVPRGIEAAITRALAREPADRFPTVAAFGAAVAAARSSGGEADRGRRRRVRVASLAGLAVAVAAAGWFLRARQPSGRGALDPHLVAVLPFRIAAPGTNLAGWGEGMVDLLGAKLTGEGGPRAADPRATLASYRTLTAGGVTADLPQRLAGILGAGRVLDGSIVGGANRVVVSAGLTTMPGGQRGTQVSVEGPPDSLIALVDRMAILLLGRDAGEAGRPLATQTTLPAWEAYLEGRSSLRHGRSEAALRAYRNALAEDSTFVLAGLDLLRLLWRQGDDDSTALRLVVSNLGRLGPADSLWARAVIGPNYPASDNSRQRLRLLEQLVARFPDQPDAWFELGDLQFHEGPLIDLDSSSRAAERSMARAVALDSTYGLALDHLVMIAIEQGDTAAMRRAFALREGRDPSGIVLPFLRWRVAIARGDSATVRQVRGQLGSLPPFVSVLLIDLAQADGVGLGDAALALADLRTRATTPVERSRVANSSSILALNRGHPREVSPGAPPSVAIGEALWGEGDTGAARAAAQAVTSSAGHPVSTHQGWLDRVALGFWQLAHHDVTGAAATTAGLRRAPSGAGLWDRDTADDSLLGPRLLEAWMLVDENRSEAQSAVRQLDSIAATGPATDLGRELALGLARLFERLGEPERAWRALERVPWLGRNAAGLDPAYRSTLLLARARNASRSGRPAEARRDYQVYLALRSDPDPALVPERDSARAELARLRRPPGR